jgi:hypothetical protein
MNGQSLSLLSKNQLSLACAAQNIDRLVLNKLLDLRTSRTEYFLGSNSPGLSKYLTDGCCHSQAEVGVDIDLANGH